MKSSIYFAFVSIPLCWLFYVWSVGFNASGDHLDVPGLKAKQRLRHFWPESVTSDDVDHFSILSHLGFGSHEILMTMQCRSQVAHAWQWFLHEQYQRKIQEIDEDKSRVVEVKTVTNLVPFPILEVEPHWWKPNGNDFIAYQAMAWRQKEADPVSISYSSQYDPLSQKLWLHLVAHCGNGLSRRGQGDPLGDESGM